MLHQAPAQGRPPYLNPNLAEDLLGLSQNLADQEIIENF
jgi:hypothetical protein